MNSKPIPRFTSSPLIFMFAVLLAYLSGPMAFAATNIVPDPSMESGTQFWKPQDYGSAVVSTPSRTATGSIRLTHDGNGVKAQSPTHNILQSGIAGIEPGREYVYTVWVKGDNVQGIGAGGKPMSVLRWLDSRDRKLAGDMYMWAPYNTYDWKELKIHLQAPLNAGKINVGFRSWWDVTGGFSYWDDASLVPREFPFRDTLTGSYQAEDGTVSNGVVETLEPDYTGSAYVKPGTGGYVEWNNVDGGAGGTRIISIRYAHEGNQKDWELFVNGVSQGGSRPVATGRLSSWASHDWEVELQPGANTLRLKAIKYTKGPLFDRIDVYTRFDPATTTAAPAISPDGGAISDTTSISLSTTTSGASIHYTIDGTTPTTGSTLYTGPFTLAFDATIKALAVAPGLNSSAVSSAAFAVSQAVAATPVITPDGGAISASTAISLSTTTPGATIHYTTDGSAPTTASTPYTGPFTLSASATVRAVAVAAGMADSAVASASFTVGTGAGGQQPYGGAPISLPGLVEVEDYDLGGEGVAYHDATAGNKGGQYRSDDVDIWMAASGEGTYTGSNASGEWQEYTVDVAAAGDYILDIRVTTPKSGKRLHVEFNGVDVTGPVAVPNTGSWEAWQTISVPVTLGAGQQVMRLVIESGGLNVNWIDVRSTGGPATVSTPVITPDGGVVSTTTAISLSTATSGATIHYTTDGGTPTAGSTLYTGPFTLSTSATVKAIAVASGMSDSAVGSASFTISTGGGGQQPYGGSPVVIPGLVETENYDLGGEGVAYHDTSAGNSGAQYRSDDVDIWVSGNGEGTFTGANISGEWQEYTVDVASAGDYTIDLRVATPKDAKQIHLEFNGLDVTGPIAVPNTGGWATWQTVSIPATLTAGQQVMRLAIDAGGLNINWIDIRSSGGTPTVSTPVISPNGGEVSTSSPISLSTTTTGAAIHFTMDGSTPTAASPLYTGPFTLSAGATVKAIAVAAGMDDSAIASASFTIGTGGGGQQPFGGAPIAVPGVVEVEDYDTGGEGVAYHDTTAGNKGGVHRSDDVDIWQDPAEGIFVGANASGEWREYTVDVAAAGDYIADLRLSTPKTDKRIHLEFGGIDVTGPIVVPNTGAWAAWQTISVPVTLVAGQQVMRLAIDKGGLNINWIALRSSGGGTSAAMPEVFPAGGNYTGSVPVTLSSATAGAVIYYTTGGGVPTTASTRYTGPFTLTGSATVQAIAVAPGFADSATASADFTILPQVTDDFNDGNANGWITVDDSGDPSSWTVVNGEFRQNNFVGFLGTALSGTYHLGTYAYLNSAFSHANYRLSAKMIPMAASGQDMGVMFRYQDSGNYYRLSFNAADGFSRLEKRVGGQFTTLARNARGHAPGIPMNVIIDVRGNNMLVTVDGVKLFAANDASLNSGTVALFCRDQCAFDDVSLAANGTAPTVAIAGPEDHSVSPLATIPVSAVALNAPAGASVGFALDGSGAACTAASEPSPGYFQAQCTSAGPGIYTVAATLSIQGAVADTDTHAQVGLQGDNIITEGDSITQGVGDNFSRAGNSATGRRTSIQGYQAELMDLLDAARPYPSNVHNDAIPGDKTVHVINDRMASVIERHPDSNTVLVLLGTNDAGGSFPVASGLGCSGTACNGTFKGNMQALIDGFSAAGNSVYVALVPPRFGDKGTSAPYADPLSHQKNAIIIQGYNDVIRNELTNMTVGPDLFSYFLGGGTNRFTLFGDNLHPNGLGTRVMARLWNNVLTGSATQPFVLDNICVRLAAAAACETPVPYKQNLLEKGDAYYTDRSWTLTSQVPAVLADGVWIMTSDQDRDLANGDYLSFDVPQSALVYIAYDAGAATLPAWLSAGYADTGLQLQTGNPSAPVMNVYKGKAAVSGNVVLAGAEAGTHGAAANYLAIVVRQ